MRRKAGREEEGQRSGKKGEKREERNREGREHRKGPFNETINQSISSC